MADSPQGTESERYTHGYANTWIGLLHDRRAAREAAFFLPHLVPGIRLLDCGCGHDGW